MRRPLLVLLIVLGGLGIWCLSKKDFIDTALDKQTTERQYSSRGESVGFSPETFDGINCTTESANEIKWFDLSDVQVSIAIPCGYDLVLPNPNSWGVRGSFRQYYFRARPGTPLPHLDAMYFITKGTVPKIEPNCPGLCTPVVTYSQFIAAQQLWKTKTSDKQLLGETEYIITDERMLGDETYREYRTFVGDTMVDVVMAPTKDLSVRPVTDEIISLIKFKTY